MLRLNVGSGQRRFDGHGWVNIDCVSRPGQVPDLICDVTKELLPDNADLIALVHVLEHWTLMDGVAALKECHRSLVPGGSLIVIVPDLKALAKAWLRGEITDYIYIVNLMGAYQGEIGDIHKWHWTREALDNTLLNDAGFQSVMPFNWRVIPGAESLSSDWWYWGCEAIK